MSFFSAITNVVVVSLEGLAKSTLNIFFISLVSCGISFAGGLLKEIIDALIGSGMEIIFFLDLFNNSYRI